MKGFTLPELLIAMLLSTLVVGAVIVLILPVQGLTQAQLETADLQQRLRVTVRRMSADIAGAHEVLPFRAGSAGDDRLSGVFYRPDVLTVRASGQSRTYYLRFDPLSGANQLMQYDGGAGDFPLVDHVVSLRFAYVGGSSVAPCVGAAPDAVSEVTIDAALLTDGPWCPDDTSVTRVDADVLRFRRVSVRLRVQVAHPSLRGAGGLMFAAGGTARNAVRYVPDQEIGFDVALRNRMTLP